MSRCIPPRKLVPRPPALSPSALCFPAPHAPPSSRTRVSADDREGKKEGEADEGDRSGEVSNPFVGRIEAARRMSLSAKRALLSEYHDALLASLTRTRYLRSPPAPPRILLQQRRFHRRPHWLPVRFPLVGRAACPIAASRLRALPAPSPFSASVPSIRHPYSISGGRRCPSTPRGNPRRMRAAPGLSAPPRVLPLWERREAKRDVVLGVSPLTRGMKLERDVRACIRLLVPRQRISGPSARCHTSSGTHSSLRCVHVHAVREGYIALVADEMVWLPFTCAAEEDATDSLARD
ncbi:hypothetical protein B0H19DRAFT_1266823 [Mycena capillaripes]|nr:hypothetical protein B0H19DRAFT_1266823 [Mycena capillaripes]